MTTELAKLTFENDGLEILPNVLSNSEIQRIIAEIRLIENQGCLNGNDDSDRVNVFYAVLPLEALLLQMKETIENLVKTRIYPSYSFMWLYKKGSQMPRHTDKESAEIAVSLNLASSSVAPWPLYIELKNKNVVAIDLKPGDMLLLDGKLLEHWRQTSPLDWRLQVLLLYVRQNSHELRFDGRAMLADPPIADNITSPYKRGLKLNIDLGPDNDSFIYRSQKQAKVK